MSFEHPATGPHEAPLRRAEGRHIHSHRPEGRSAALLALLASLSLIAYLSLFAAAAGAQCVRAEFPDEYDPMRNQGPQLAHIEASGIDLWVEIEASDAPNVLELVDDDGLVVASATLAPITGRQSILLDGALAELPERGFQFHLRVVDTVTLETLLEEPVRFGLECAEDDSCQWQAMPYFHSDGPVADRALVETLDELAEAGISDPYGTILSDYPELRSRLYEYLLQLQMAESGLGETGDATGDATGDDAGDGTPGGSLGCLCDWVGIVARDPSYSAGQRAGSPPLHEHAYWSGGTGFWTTQMTSGSHQAVIPVTTSYLGFRVLCSESLGFDRLVVLVLPKMRQIKIQIPVVDPCESPCAGQIRHSISFDLCTSARGFARSGATIDADVNLTTDAWVDNTHLFHQPIRAQLTTSAPGGETRSATASPAATITVFGKSSEFRARSSGHALLNIASSGSPVPVPYLYADAGNRPSVFLSADSTCTLTPHRMLMMGGGNSGGGTVIERWGDPP